MARKIDSEVAYQFLTEQKIEGTGARAQGVNKGLDIARSAMRNPCAIPTITTGWISVEEGLPMEGTVLATDGNVVITAPSSSVTADGPAITHWMPLPEPPEAAHE